MHRLIAGAVYPVLAIFLMGVASQAIAHQVQGAVRSPFVRKGKPEMSVAQITSAKGARYEKLELTLDVSATYENPFDPDDVDITATFTSPSGKTVGGTTISIPGTYTLHSLPFANTPTP